MQWARWIDSVKTAWELKFEVGNGLQTSGVKQAPVPQWGTTGSRSGDHAVGPQQTIGLQQQHEAAKAAAGKAQKAKTQQGAQTCNLIRIININYQF